MAHIAMHTRNDSGVSVHSFIVHDNPPSPTLTNPDMIVPIPPWQNEPSSDDQGPHPLLEPEIPLSQSISNTSLSTARSSAEELGVATAVLMPSRLSTHSSTTAQSNAAGISIYTEYEHGAPLSDIYEESEATATPKSSHTVRDDRSPSPPPTREKAETPTRPALRHKKRISSLSTSSSGGSDVGDWENFDSSKILSSRVAADLAQLKREDTLEVESSDAVSRRQSREEEELAALNAHAEKILENARKRLTHMEDNLKVARNSIIVPARSPNLGAEHQPVGGLYRSISAAGATKLGKNRQQFLPIRTTASLQHMRGTSETGVASTNKRLSRLSDTRSASVLEYGSPTRYSLFPDSTLTTPVRTQPSPTSSKSFNSPLRPLGEERNSPSTAQTTPENAKDALMRGLGIKSVTPGSKENEIGVGEQQNSRQTPTPTLHMRSTSSASTRSTKELKDQMTDLKTRIADLKSRAQADNLRRRSLQSLRSPSPLTAANAEHWYASSPVYNESSSPLNASAGIGWRSSTSPSGPSLNTKMEIPAGNDESAPVTPAHKGFLDIGRITPNTEAHILSSARTDRNTPSLARKRDVIDDEAEHVEEIEGDRSSIVGPSDSHYEDASDEVDDQGAEDEDAEQIAENEEEQIYLNEVLEESLREAEVEPEVPAIPGSFLEGQDGVPLSGSEAQRHEDRLDAFDYENMFLHSAMGNYTGRSLNGSDSGSDDDSEDDGSVETSRVGARTPTDDMTDQEQPEIESAATENLDDMLPQSPIVNVEKTNPGGQNIVSNNQFRSPPKVQLPQPPKPWLHTRNKSMDSVSSAATFQTATEGEDEDETPDEILNWDPTPSSSLGYSPTSYQAYRPNQNSPMRSRHGFSSPQAGGRITPLSPRTTTANSPLRQQAGQHYEPIYDREKAQQTPGLGLGVIGGENAQYINDNGVPERFQGQPSPTHSRQSSTGTTQQFRYRPESQATIVAASPAKAHQRHISQAALRLQASSPLTPAGRNSGSPVVVTVTSSPQRKVVINRSLQQPESYVLEPQISNPPDAPLPPPPPSSAVLQAQMASPKKVDIKSRSNRPGSAQKRTPPTPQQQLQSQLRTPPSLRDTATSPAEAGPLPNTEILMESLIKLADPSFTLAPGIRFEEVDKNLVLGLLGAVGGVCNDILRASVQSGSPSLGRLQTEEMVHRLRQRLEGAAYVLEGLEEERVTTSRQGLRIKEI